MQTRNGKVGKLGCSEVPTFRRGLAISAGLFTSRSFVASPELHGRFELREDSDALRVWSVR
jgi:hypothetical protein